MCLWCKPFFLFHMISLYTYLWLCICTYDDQDVPRPWTYSVIKRIQIKPSLVTLLRPALLHIHICCSSGHSPGSNFGMLVKCAVTLCWIWAQSCFSWKSCKSFQASSGDKVAKGRLEFGASQKTPLSKRHNKAHCHGAGSNSLSIFLAFSIEYHSLDISELQYKKWNSLFRDKLTCITPKLSKQVISNDLLWFCNGYIFFWGDILVHHSIHWLILCMRHVMYHFKFIICICLEWERANFSVCRTGVTLFKQEQNNSIWMYCDYKTCRAMKFIHVRLINPTIFPCNM